MSEKDNPDLTSCNLCTYGYSACSHTAVIARPHALCVPTVTMYILTLQ